MEVVPVSRDAIRGGCWGAVLAVVLASAAAAQTVPTNYELVRETARRACLDLVAGVRAHATSAVALRAIGAASGNFLVENAFASVLAENDVTVRTRPDSAGPVLEFEVVDLGVAYVGTNRRLAIGAQKVEREARARVFARLVDPAQQRVLWADQANVRVRDEVRGDDLALVEERNPPDYAKATLPASRWNKLVEPIVVSGIVVGLIVLFFLNQETN